MNPAKRVRTAIARPQRPQPEPETDQFDLLAAINAANKKLEAGWAAEREAAHEPVKQLTVAEILAAAGGSTRETNPYTKESVASLIRREIEAGVIDGRNE